MSKFKVGDTVRCIDNEGAGGQLTFDKEYSVVEMEHDYFTWVINDAGRKDGFFPDRFELAESEKEPEPEAQQPETFEYHKKIYRRATASDSGKQGIMCDLDIADAEIRITNPYVSKGIMKHKADVHFPWRKTTTNSDWKFGYIEVEQAAQPKEEPTVLERVTSKIERSTLIYNYLDAKDAFERASTAFNEACQAIRDNVKDGEKFVYTRYGEGYIVQRDAAGFTVDKIDLI